MKKLTAILLSIALILSCAVTTVIAETPTDATGTTFTATDVYKTTNPLTSMPLTWEVDVEVSADAGKDRLGVIVGNYNSSGVDCANLEIYQNGNPRLYISADSYTKSVLFDKVNLVGLGRVNLAVTYDNINGVVRCYINGELKQTVSIADKSYVWDGNKTVKTFAGGTGDKDDP